MKLLHIRLSALLAFTIFIFISISACENGAMLHPEVPTPQAAEATCAPFESGMTTYTEVRRAEHGALYVEGSWDTIFHVWYTFPPIPTPEHSCRCEYDEFCVYLNFPMYTGEGFRIGVSYTTDPNDTTIILTPSQTFPNGYDGFTPSLEPDNPHLDMSRMIGGAPAPTWHQVCNTKRSFYVKVKYPDEMSVLDHPPIPVMATSGICIVQIIGDPPPGDD